MKTVVTLKKLAESMKLQNMTPEIDMEKVLLTTPEVNRPALELTGYYDHFVKERVQIIGYVEHGYMERMREKKKQDIYLT